MHDHLGNHASEEEADQTNSEAEASPVMTVLEDLKSIALEVNLTVKVHLVEGLHGDLVLATVLGLVGLVLELEVVLNALVGETSLLILAGANGRDNQPEGSEEREVDEDGEEDKSLEATTDLPLQIVRDTDEDGDEEGVAERVGTRAVRRERSIGNGRRL